jgi:hypothetical protein
MAAIDKFEVLIKNLLLFLAGEKERKRVEKLQANKAPRWEIY